MNTLPNGWVCVNPPDETGKRDCTAYDIFLFKMSMPWWEDDDVLEAIEAEWLSYFHEDTVHQSLAQHRDNEQHWRDRVAEAAKPITKEIRQQVYERDGHKCLHCGTTDNLSVDHIIPKSKLGPTRLDNLQTLCRSCNIKKGVRT